MCLHVSRLYMCLNLYVICYADPILHVFKYKDTNCAVIMILITACSLTSLGGLERYIASHKTLFKLRFLASNIAGSCRIILLQLFPAVLKSLRMSLSGLLPS